MEGTSTQKHIKIDVNFMAGGLIPSPPPHLPSNLPMDISNRIHYKNEIDKQGERTRVAPIFCVLVGGGGNRPIPVLKNTWGRGYPPLGLTLNRHFLGLTSHFFIPVSREGFSPPCCIQPLLH